jgi:hypothetical protein
MPEPVDAFSTLDDFLLSLADGIAQAQGELTRAGTHGPPGQQFAYHLPRVDFELKMNLRVVDDPALTKRYQTLHPYRTGDRHLLFRPLGPQEAASALEIAAVVRGAFVAVPANAGLPPPMIRTAVVASDPPAVRIVARNAAGEPLAGIEVQVNVDREESVELSRAVMGADFRVAPGTRFERGVVTTDPAGLAEAVLRVDPEQPPGLLALVIDLADRTETLVYEVRP